MEDFVHDYFSVERFKNAYKRNIEPLPDKTQWPDVDLPFVVGAPLGKRGRGRPRKLRMKSCLSKVVTAKAKKLLQREAKRLTKRQTRKQWKLQNKLKKTKRR